MEIQIAIGIILLLVIIYLLVQEYKKRTTKAKAYCPNCGAPLMETSNFCSHCGYLLKEKAKPELKKPEPVQEDTGTQFFITQDPEVTQDLSEGVPKLLLEININSMKSEIEVSKFPCLIGRLTGECDILLEEPAVGRKHASLEYENKAFWITDLQSHNGVYVNSIKIDTLKKVRIKQGDRIKIGRAELIVL